VGLIGTEAPALLPATRTRRDLPAACRAVAGAGAQRIVVVPLFLGTGGHLRKDLPALLEAAQHSAGVPVASVPAAGESPLLLHALADYCLASVSPLGDS
jgi:sirohydrochlorin cobaltochelatase